MCTGEGNANPLQYSCLEDPMDGGAWWATVHRVAKSWTRLNTQAYQFTLFLQQKSIQYYRAIIPQLKKTFLTVFYWLF